MFAMMGRKAAEHHRASPSFAPIAQARTGQQGKQEQWHQCFKMCAPGQQLAYVIDVANDTVSVVI
jgi:hypothetical protein